MSQHETKARAGMSKTYLTFVIGGKKIAIELLRVREIISLQDCVPTLDAPAPVEGLVDLRGRALPLIDLGLCMEGVSTRTRAESCIIVFEVELEALPPLQVGCAVDRIDEIYDTTRAETLESHSAPGSGRTRQRAIRLPDSGVVMPLMMPDQLLSLEQLTALNRWLLRNHHVLGETALRRA